MSQSAPRLHFLDSRGQDRSLLSEPISSLEQISRFRILQIRTGPSWSKMKRTLVDQMIKHYFFFLIKRYVMDRCWQNKPGYLVDGRAAVSCLE